MIFYHSNDFLPLLVSYYLVSIAKLIFFLLQNEFSKHSVVLKNDYITPKILLSLPKLLTIHNAKVSYH